VGNGEGSGLGLEGPVDGLFRAGEGDEPVAFDRGLPCDGLLGAGIFRSRPRGRSDRLAVVSMAAYASELSLTEEI